ncbi:hypothetical protein E2C01_015688 [Portunus trituberculatus]|uniref:Uncharacterized protein n=1 Tax=Portunus trituberculatus TaxID=210409 RepID=A0A5B7DMK7_PORTR|nr:hypothetical protein [Portunus trituberculatus]
MLAEGWCRRHLRRGSTWRS